MERPNQRWLGRPQNKQGKSKLGAGVELAEIYILRECDLLTQCTALEKGEENVLHAPLVTDLNFLLPN